MKNIYLFLAALLGFHLLVLSRLQFTAWPEMVSFPYFINHGFVLYKDAVHAYPPLLVTCLALLYKIFGYKLVVLEIFGWVTILISDLLIFSILRKLVSNNRSLSLRDWRLVFVGVFVYAILQPILEGNMVWPDLFMTPFLLATIYLILDKKYFFGGIVIGLALLTKQTAGLYVICSMVYVVFLSRSYKKLTNFMFGIAIPVLPFLAILLEQNSLLDFINWTIVYPSTFWTKFPGYVNLNLSLRNSLSLMVLLAPIFLLLFKVGRKTCKDLSLLLIISFFVCGIVGVYPRFSFFHLQPALAFFVLTLVYLFSKTKINSYCLLLVPVLILFLNFRSLQFGEARFWSQGDMNLASKIQSQTPKDEPIYLLGLNSNLYVLADRLPNKPWLDNFGWYLEIPGVQEEVVKSLSSNAPSKIFWRTPDGGNWYDLGVYQPKKITDWIVANYNMKGEIERGIVEWSKR